MSVSTSLAELTDCAKKTYRDRYGRQASWVTAAPGRVNLIGEHTDYNDGFVLPMAIDRYTVVAAGPRDDSQPAADVYSATMDDQRRLALDRSVDSLPTWARYVQGVLDVYRSQSIEPEPLNAVIDSTVPLGGGLSSSAALEVSVATLLELITGACVEPKQKALLCQRAEHEGPGVPCGIMDQFISVLAEPHKLMLLDCQSQEVEMVPLDDPDVVVLIINSNVKHELTGGEYAERRAQCEAAAKRLGVKSLRDVSPHELAASAKQLEPLLLKRARHVVGEIDRTVRAAAAIREGNWPLAGQLMMASHESLRDDYQVSCAELDALVDAAREIGPAGGVYGSRMTGGGFGGCTVSLVSAADADTISDSIGRRYQEQCGIEPTAFVTVPARGAHVIEGA